MSANTRTSVRMAGQRGSVLQEVLGCVVTSLVTSFTITKMPVQAAIFPPRPRPPARGSALYRPCRLRSYDVRGDQHKDVIPSLKGGMYTSQKEPIAISNRAIKE